MRRYFTSRPKSTTNKRRAKSKEVKNFSSNPKIEEDDFEKKISFNCKEMKEIADKIHRANVLKTQENKIKDEEIDTLNEEIRQLMITNFELQTAIHKELELRHTYETEQRKIAAYCNDLSYKFRNMEKTISDLFH